MSAKRTSSTGENNDLFLSEQSFLYQAGVTAPELRAELFANFVGLSLTLGLATVCSRGTIRSSSLDMVVDSIRQTVQSGMLEDDGSRKRCRHAYRTVDLTPDLAVHDRIDTEAGQVRVLLVVELEVEVALQDILQQWFELLLGLDRRLSLVRCRGS